MKNNPRFLCLLETRQMQTSLPQPRSLDLEGWRDTAPTPPKKTTESWIVPIILFLKHAHFFFFYLDLLKQNYCRLCYLMFLSILNVDHINYFSILKQSFWNFERLWEAVNGSRTKTQVLAWEWKGLKHLFPLILLLKWETSVQHLVCSSHSPESLCDLLPRVWVRASHALKWIYSL